ncbi:MAG: hypothetical protein DRO05_02510 [Thermoproteota archaeon]|nr:MAG: hypothetical protein DRO05_02510 [Candidatus Korarchaeota archaeon]
MISVVVPAYNEERTIEECFKRIYSVLKDSGYEFEVLLEQDGSSDQTPHIIEELSRKFENVEAISFPERRGKGFGIRKCLERVRGDIIVLIDADLEYPPEKIPEMVEIISNGEADIVVARRVNSRRCFVRSFLSSIYRFILLVLFGKNFHDPQSGLKAVKREVIDEIWPIASDGFEIDAEILIKAHNNGFKISYVPIKYAYRGESKVSVLKDPLKMLSSLIKWRLYGG